MNEKIFILKAQGSIFNSFSLMKKECVWYEILLAINQYDDEDDDCVIVYRLGYYLQVKQHSRSWCENCQAQNNVGL